MKRFAFLLGCFVLMAGMGFAQRQPDGAVQVDGDFFTRLQQAEPTKAVKKAAKALRKEGWEVPMGEKSLEEQLMRREMYEQEMMRDGNGTAMPRFILQTGSRVSGSYRMGLRVARTYAQAELAGMLQTEIESLLQSDVKSVQTNGGLTETVEISRDQILARANETVRNSIPVMVMFRNKENNTVEVYVCLGFDRKDVLIRN